MSSSLLPSAQPVATQPPRYYSSRDPERRLCSFADALLTGLAPDGGLFLPEAIPLLPASWREAASFAELGHRLLWPWLADSIDADTLGALLEDALHFPLELQPLADDIAVLELFHGPTLSFKDVGARTMARLMNYFLRQRQQQLIILVATSGDTGSAVADGFAAMDNIAVVLLYPKGKVSPVQERQLIVKRPGLHSLAVEGSFDDCQRLVKTAFRDPALAHMPLSSANSINVGRLLPQAIYYCWAWQQADLAEGIACVPSGNLGNLTAGVLAARMGLGIRQFIAAHNSNDYFPQFLADSCPAYAFKATAATLSNAMDVGAPSNFERLDALLQGDAMRQHIHGVSISDEDTCQRMQQLYHEQHYLACPHTAVGLEAAARYRREPSEALPIISLATAHPAKFPEVVQMALDIEPPKAEVLEQLWQRQVAVQDLPPDPEALREFLLAIA